MYCKSTKAQTVVTKKEPISLLLALSNWFMVRPARFEQTAFGFGGQRAIRHNDYNPGDRRSLSIASRILSAWPRFNSFVDLPACRPWLLLQRLSAIPFFSCATSRILHTPTRSGSYINPCTFIYFSQWSRGTATSPGTRLAQDIHCISISRPDRRP